jgi:hypothetical protein
MREGGARSLIRKTRDVAGLVSFADQGALVAAPRVWGADMGLATSKVFPRLVEFVDESR